MTDDVLAAIRSVSDRALREISPPRTESVISADPQDTLLLDALAARADPGGVDLSGAKLRTTRRALLKLIRPSTEAQWAFNTDVHRALSQAMAAIRSERSGLDAVRAGLVSLEVLADAGSARVSDLQDAVNDRPTRAEFEALSGLVDRMNSESATRTDFDDAADRYNAGIDRLESMLHHQQHRVDDLAGAVGRLEAAVERSQGELARHRSVVDLAMRELRSSASEGGPDVDAATRPLDESYDQFYDEFEAALRGSREHLLEQQRQYLTMVSEVPGPVLDIGPGRGEWLQLLGDTGIEASGVDINSKFVAECTSRGLDVVHADAFDHLRSLPESSLGAITAFQVVEHLPFEALVDLLGLCLVALRPGGVLILETPNPSNLKVGAMTFWNDPSHVHPLPPSMFEFLVAWRGFTDVAIYFPNSGPQRSLVIDGVQSDELDDINWAMFGPLDYAIVARRP